MKLEAWELFDLRMRRQGKPETKVVESWKYSGAASRGVKFESEKKGGAMQREFDEVEMLLNLWADAMHKWENPVEGYPSKASGGFVPSWCKDTEESADNADAETLVKIDAAYDSLQRIYQDAICRHYSLGSQVWRFAKAASFEDAKTVIRVKFVLKGLL